MTLLFKIYMQISVLINMINDRIPKSIEIILREVIFMMKEKIALYTL